MKDFVKMTLAVMCGLFIMGIIGFFLFFFSMGAIVASVGSSSTKTVLPREGVLKIDMSKFILGEQSQPEDPSTYLKGDAISTIGIWDAVKAINAAAEDPGVKYIYLKADGVAAGIGSAYEFRQALANFRKSGKAVIAYTENPSTGSYYISSVADKVYMTSYYGSNNMFFGVSSQLVFLKDLLDKLGVNVQLIRHGKYKSAGEMYVKNQASPENMEQNQVMINSIWNTYAQGIAQSRGITVDKLNSLIDNLALNSPKDFLANKLVDGVMSYQDLEKQLAVLYETDSFSDVKMIPFVEYVTAKEPVVTPGKKNIAIVYVDGEIVEGKDTKNIAGDTFAAMLEEVKADSTIKAVVLRVNSPGGSVLASDKIKSEIDAIKSVKPLVASFGNYAASGGYWISNNCDHIFSDPSTLTGSIGVFGMIPDFSKTAKNVLHVNVTTVSSNKHGDMYSLMRPFDAQETAYMQASIEGVYSAFVSTVAKGRDLKAAFVDSIAQGRVWTGSDAIKLGLVDEIGTLEDAIHYAAKLASSTGEDDLSSWTVVGYPQPLTTMEMLMQYFETTTTDDGVLLGRKSKNIFVGTPFAGIYNAFATWNPKTSDRIYARMPYEIVIR
jgi:protease-4